MQSVSELHPVAAGPHGAVLRLLSLPLPPGQAGPGEPAQQRRELRQQRQLVLQVRGIIIVIMQQLLTRLMNIAAATTRGRGAAAG